MSSTSPRRCSSLAHDSAAADIRIFTPALELPFAGHPVLGTAFVLGERSGADLVTLRPPAGPVPVALTRGGDGTIVHGEMEQPLPVAEPFEPVGELLDALGVQPEPVLPVTAYRQRPAARLRRAADEAAVAALRPDLGRVDDLGEFGVSCFAVDADAGRVKTRMFGPGVGVAEDPATGSAAGPLAVHLCAHGVIDYGRRIEIRQGAEINRPSLLLARADGSGDRLERVLVGGSAVIVARGTYRLG